MTGVLDDFARLGFLSVLQIRVAEEVHGVRLVMRFRHVHFGGVRSGIAGRYVGVDGILPEPQANENVRRHVQRVGRLRRNRGVAARGFQSLRG